MPRALGLTKTLLQQVMWKRGQFPTPALAPHHTYPLKVLILLSRSFILLESLCWELDTSCANHAFPNTQHTQMKTENRALTDYQ